MASSYDTVVETILKVDEKLLLENDQAIPMPDKYVSIDSECDDWKMEPHDASCDILSSKRKHESSITDSEDDIFINGINSEEMSMAVREWPLPRDSLISNPKIVSSSISQSNSCNIQTLPIDDFFLQFDYKTRNKLKTKQRRLDPCYRSQERVRQRTMMQLKRQDPTFRDEERARGRCRMRMKRLDPAFRSQERERQRARMKIKRNDPDFREKEREKQKTRLLEKTLNPNFKEKEREQENLRAYIKRQNSYLPLTKCADKAFLNPNIRLLAENSTFKSYAETFSYPVEMRNTQAVFPENIKAMPSIESRELPFEAFSFKKQRILSFYNSNKGQWTAQEDETSSQTKAQLKIVEGSEIFKTLPIETETNHFPNRLNSLTPKSIVINQLKTEDIVDIKQEKLSLPGHPQEERPFQTSTIN